MEPTTCPKPSAECWRKRAWDLLSLCLGLASLTIFKFYSFPDIEVTLLLASGAVFCLSCPLLSLTLERSHLLTEKGLLSEKRAHFCLLVSSQGMAVCSLLAFQRMDLGDHRAIAQVSNVVTPIISYYLMDASLNPKQIFLLPLSFVGVILLCRPTEIFKSGSFEDYMTDVSGVFLALGAATCHSLVSVSFNVIRRTPALVSISTTSAAAVILWSTLCAVRKASFQPCVKGAVITSCSCLLSASFFARRSPWCRTSRLQAAISCSELILAYGLQMIALGSLPHWTSAVGAVVIGLCAFGTVMCEKVTAIRTSSIGSQFSILTRRISTGTQEMRSETEAFTVMGLNLRTAREMRDLRL